MAEIEMEKRRFAILRHLNETNGKELSVDMLKMGCRAQGYPSSGDQVRTAIDWLTEQGLVTSNRIGSMITAKLSEDGEDVATGNRVMRGVLS